MNRPGCITARYDDDDDDDDDDNDDDDDEKKHRVWQAPVCLLSLSYVR